MATLTKAEFYFVMPAAATNEVLNPSAEKATTGYYGYNATIARVSTQQRRGAYCIEATPTTGVAAHVYYQPVNEVSGVTRTFSVDVKGVAGQTMAVQIATTASAPLSTTTFTATGYWQRVKVTYTGTSTTTRRLVVVRDAVASTAPFYVDGFYYSTVDGTYLDGDMAGFVPSRKDYGWNGTPHASTSYRTADTRSGGTLLKISDYATIISFFGFGMASLLNIAHPTAIDRSSYQTTRATDREFVLNLAFTSTELQIGQIQDARQIIINAVNPDLVTVKQPLIIRYQGYDSSDNEASEPMDFYAHYVDGLEGTTDNRAAEFANVRFVSYLPYVAKAADTGKALGYQTSVSNFANIGYRDTDGTWKAMGAGVNNAVNVIAIGLDGSVYAGGGFSSAGGVANTNGIAKWDGSAWSALGTGASGLGAYALVVGPDGSLYAGGGFTSMGGVANTSRIAKWNGSAWSALGTGANDTVLALAFGPDGSLYAGGSFTSMGGVANTAYIAKWNGTAWSALGTGMNSYVTSLAFGFDGTLYAGGNFTTAGGVSTDYIAKWDGSAWSALGTGMDTGDVRTLAIGSDGSLYAGGDFVTAGNVTVNYIAKWNGTAWSALGTGVSGGVAWSLVVSPDGFLYVGGDFTAVSGMTTPDRGAVWNNGLWIPVDINVQDTAAYFNAYAFDNAGRLYLGGEWSGTTALSSTVTVSNAGGVRAYPILNVTGPGRIYNLTNYTTGKSIYFYDLVLQAGETMTLDLRQARFKFTSTWKARGGGTGNMTARIADGSDLDWFLNGGNNNVALLMLSTTAATAAQIHWNDLYWSIDGGKR